MADDAHASINLLDMIWPETGLQVAVDMPQQPKNALGEDDRIAVTLDFVTLSLSLLEFIQLAASFRFAVDGLLDAHPAMQRAVVAAFDIQD